MKRSRTISVKLDIYTIMLLDAKATELGISRSELIRRIIKNCKDLRIDIKPVIVKTKRITVY